MTAFHMITIWISHLNIHAYALYTCMHTYNNNNNGNNSQGDVSFMAKRCLLKSLKWHYANLASVQSLIEPQQQLKWCNNNNNKNNDDDDDNNNNDNNSNNYNNGSNSNNNNNYSNFLITAVLYSAPSR